MIELVKNWFCNRGGEEEEGKGRGRRGLGRAGGEA